MASKSLLTFLFISSFTIYFSSRIYALKGVYPLPCLNHIQNCNSLLYEHNNLSKEQIFDYYSVNISQISPVPQGKEGDSFITVPCSCNRVNGTNGTTVGYFYDTRYRVQNNDTFDDVASKKYSGQAWPVRGEQILYIPSIVPIHLMCGCVESDSQVVVTYTVQELDTLADIGARLSSRIEDIVNLNKVLSPNSSFIDVGWVLFVPMEKNGISSPGKASTKKPQHWVTILSILLAVAFLLFCALAIILIRKHNTRRNNQNDTKQLPKSSSTHKSFHFNSQFLNKDTMEDVTMFESERPVIYSLEEIAEATNYFDKTRIIGQGGYGTVYFGVLGKQEIAVKKMRSNKSKEFFAELKVLCRIHHINVVELLGYASGDDHLYLVYEFIPKGSLSDHLHDPLLKGHQPLSWTARAQIALDAAKGIEYIHDHTKARYVHRDIKTSNILLDVGLRAKVADFGLAKLVGRTNEDDFIATRLVGTPGYLPPESVKELQVTIKTDVFAFGVVLGELITGYRALIRDKREPSKMKSLITIISNIFQDEDPESALEHVIDANLRGSYPMDHVFKMAEIAEWCLSEEAVNRPEMREVVVALSQVTVSSVEWEASLGGDSPVFSGLFTGR